MLFFQPSFFLSDLLREKIWFFFHTIILKSFDWWTSELKNSKKLWKRINSYTLLWPWPIVTLRSIILWTMLSTQDSMGNIFLSKQPLKEVVLFKLYFFGMKVLMDFSKLFFWCFCKDMGHLNFTMSYLTIKGLLNVTWASFRQTS